MRPTNGSDLAGSDLSDGDSDLVAWLDFPVYVQALVGDAQLPRLAHEDDVGYDLFCAEDVVLHPNDRYDISMGIAIAMPASLYGRITGRSSSVRKGLLVHEGIIDPGYRGPLFAYTTNIGSIAIHIHKGDRLAQLIFAPAIRPAIHGAASLPESSRGIAGLGSTGS